MNIDEMLAGRELDDLVAQKVMQWTLDGVEWRDKQGMLKAHAKYIPSLRPMLWRPSTDIANAWQAVEKLSLLARPNVLSLYKGDTDKWVIFKGRTKHGREIAHASTAPLAICRAALKVAREANSTR